MDSAQRSTAKTLLLWDCEGAPPEGNWIVVNWRSFAEDGDGNLLSLPAYVERHSDAYRSAFLAWLHELGHARVAGKTVIDHLELRPGLSYWWMSALGQRFNASGSSPINDAIKLMAMEHIIAAEKARGLVVVSANPKLAEVLEPYSRKLGLHYEWRRAHVPAVRRPLVRRFRAALPSSVRAAAYLASRLRTRIRLTGARPSEPPPAGRVAFIDVLVHLAIDSVEKRRFVSNYWTSLVDICDRSRLRTNWLHNFFAQESIPSAGHAEEILRTFNDGSGGLQTHRLFESELSVDMLWSVLRDVARLRRAHRRLARVRYLFAPSQSKLDLWPLFRREWAESLLGPMAIVNCLRLVLYERTFEILPRQHRGFYIQENQAWEMALIHVWRAKGHGELIGVPHTTVRFWDLRYFYDPRSYERVSTRTNDLPMPDRVAVNGPVARKLYIEGGYPHTDLVDVEALRYLHLLHSASVTIGTAGNPRILVCGDFLASTTHRILSSLKKMASELPPGTTYVFKPHPAYPADLAGYDGPELRVSRAPLGELLADCDVVFTGSITSSAADAYCSGVPVVQMMDEGGFNMSPLRGLRGVAYVTSGEEAATAIREAGRRHIPQPYFYLSPGLPRWRKLLALTEDSTGTGDPDHMRRS